MIFARSASAASFDAVARYRIAAMAVVLAAYLAQQRIGWVRGHTPAGDLRVRLGAMAAAPLEDVLYVLLLAGAFSGAALLVRRVRWRVRLVWCLYVVAVILSVIAGIANLIALERLRQPISYQWLYYSDFLLSLDAYNTMSSLLSPALIRDMVLRSATVVLAGLALSLALIPLMSRARVRRPLLLGASTLVVGYLLVAGFQLRASGIDHPYRANPLFFLLASVTRPGQTRGLATMPTSVAPDDFLPVGARGAGAPVRTSSAIRNVIFYVMESVRASDVGAVGGRRGVTPTIDAAAPMSRIYPDAYAHVPSTSHSLASLMLSVYPPHTFRSPTRESPDIALPSLADELRRRGHRTGFFSAADSRFQRVHEFMQAHGLDRVEDYRSFQCQREVFRNSGPSWPFADGTSTRCAVGAMVKWIDESPGRPFFGVLWTMETHDPYFALGSQRPFHADTTYNRYLNALHQTDSALGALLRELEARDLTDSTLVIVVGDHGEAFGEHAHTNHFLLYEEDLRVPLLLINPKLFHGETDSTLVGLIDLAPTVMDLLGHPSPVSWQGRSVFDPSRPGRVYLFAPFSSVLFGYREGSMKFIYDAGADAAELYDLRADPGERVNLAPRLPDAARLGRERVAAWVQFQRDFYRAVEGNAARPVNRRRRRVPRARRPRPGSFGRRAGTPAARSA